MQQLIQEMEKLQARGEVPEEELRALEEDVTGKVCLLLQLLRFADAVIERSCSHHGVERALK